MKHAPYPIYAPHLKHVLSTIQWLLDDLLIVFLLNAENGRCSSLRQGWQRTSEAQW